MDECWALYTDVLYCCFVFLELQGSYLMYPQSLESIFDSHNSVALQLQECRTHRCFEFVPGLSCGQIYNCGSDISIRDSAPTAHIVRVTAAENSGS